MLSKKKKEKGNKMMCYMKQWNRQKLLYLLKKDQRFILAAGFLRSAVVTLMNKKWKRLDNWSF